MLSAIDSSINLRAMIDVMDDYTSGVGLRLIAINNDYKTDLLKNMCEVKYKIKILLGHGFLILCFSRTVFHETVGRKIKKNPQKVFFFSS